jgi:DNA-binding response OmpR family regulator
VVAAAVALDLDVDLVLTDLDLSAGGNGRDVARKALDLDVPVMFVTGSCPADAQQLGIGCLAKPYSQRDLLSAIDAVDAKLAGRVPKRVPRSFTFFNKA